VQRVRRQQYRGYHTLSGGGRGEILVADASGGWVVTTAHDRSLKPVPAASANPPGDAAKGEAERTKSAALCVVHMSGSDG